MKKQLLLLVMMLLPLVVSAYDAKINGIYYNFDQNAKTAEVTCDTYGYYSGSVDIPSTVNYRGNTYTVISIGYSAFRECSSLTLITIPNSLTNIGQYAFQNCRSLKSMTIPNGVTCIEDYAFQYCSNLSSVNIPNSVTSIGTCAFENCI